MRMWFEKNKLYSSILSVHNITYECYSKRNKNINKPDLRFLRRFVTFYKLITRGHIFNCQRCINKIIYRK